MPRYRSINIALHSQFDIETLPEYYPPPVTPLPGLHRIYSLTTSIPPLVDDRTSTCSVHIPVLPGSQFWIAYSISPPVPEGQYFLFKLYIDGKQVTNWSTGKENSWMGKTMFGLFESGHGSNTKRRIEKRVLSFSNMDKDGKLKDGCVEIKIHRVDARKRIDRELQVFEETSFAKFDGGISLINAGRAGPEQPKRFYKFALIDPVDQPFATFRYFYRTWDQLHDLGLLDHEYYAESEENYLSVIEPDTSSADCDNDRQDPQIGTAEQKGADDACKVDGEDVSVNNSNEKTRRETEEGCDQQMKTTDKTRSDEGTPLRGDINPPGTYIPRGAPGSDLAMKSPEPPSHSEILTTYCLSMPPSVVFEAPEPASRPLPIPQKQEQRASSTAYRPHPAYPIEDWTMRTPSPVRSIREVITTPPLLGKQKGRGIVGAGLLGAISSTWKRSISGDRSQQPGKLKNEPRSVSC